MTCGNATKNMACEQKKLSRILLPYKSAQVSTGQGEDLLHLLIGEHVPPWVLGGCNLLCAFEKPSVSHNGEWYFL